MRHEFPQPFPMLELIRLRLWCDAGRRHSLGDGFRDFILLLIVEQRFLDFGGGEARLADREGRTADGLQKSLALQFCESCSAIYW